MTTFYVAHNPGADAFDVLRKHLVRPLPGVFEVVPDDADDQFGRAMAYRASAEEALALALGYVESADPAYDWMVSEVQIAVFPYGGRS